VGAISDLSTENTLVDPDTGLAANVTTISGKNKLEVNASISAVFENVGVDLTPSSWFSVDAGATNDTVRVEIPAFSIDVTTTLTATESGDDLALRDLIIFNLDADSNFSANFSAEVTTSNPVVNIRGLKIDGIGEAPVLTVTPTGTTTIILGFSDIVSRSKKIALIADPNDQRVGRLTGDFSTQPSDASDIVQDYAKNGGSNNLLVDGSSTPVVFTFPSFSDVDFHVRSIRFSITSINVKLGQFLSVASLTNGINVEITANGTVTGFFPSNFKDTEDFFEFFNNVGPPVIVRQPSGDLIVVVRAFLNTPVLKKGSADKIVVTINDNLTTGAATRLRLVVEGFRK